MAEGTAAVYPFTKFRYEVTIGSDKIGFSEVSGYEASIEAVDYREGDANTLNPLKVAGKRSYGNITLKWGVTDSKTLYDWMAKGMTGEVERKTVAISLKNDAGEAKATWQIVNAFPVKYSGPEFNATSSEVAIETLELAHEGLSRES